MSDLIAAVRLPQPQTGLTAISPNSTDVYPYNVGMELVVFDLDGTLLNRHSEISPYTRETLEMLTSRQIAYTVATGRTLHASRDIIKGHGFVLPHIYKNGVVIWHPEHDHFTHHNILTTPELKHVVDSCIAQEVTPFVFTLEGNNDYRVFHDEPKNAAERYVVNEYTVKRGLVSRPLPELPDDAIISNISAVGHPTSIKTIVSDVADEAHLVAYSGIAIENGDVYWLDIHHSDASKGNAVNALKALLGVDKVICFGDSDNDLSLFELADEAYAPDNAKDHVKAKATAVIGHHDDDGIARFLRERFSLT